MEGDQQISSVGRGGLAACFGIVALALAVSLGVAACGSDAPAVGSSCTDDTDCQFGLVCSESGECVEADDCDFCDDDMICVQDGDQEYCAVATECETDADCGPNFDCIDGYCAGESGGDDECDTDADCPDGYSCHPVSNACTPDDNAEECTTDGDCPGDQVCEDNSCVDDECTLQASDCEGAAPYFDDEACECVECQDETDCAANEECTNGSCIDPDESGCISGQPCDPDNPGDCGGDTPYCIDECCVECIGAADCEGDELCNDDGFCGESQSCTQDADCPSGYNCENGECVPPQTGQQCDDDDDCPDGQFCNPETDQCESLGGDLGCGLCNDDCTCDGDLTCDGFVCTGCVWLQGDCADDQCCYPLDGEFSLNPEEGMCMDESMCPDADDFLGG